MPFVIRLVKITCTNRKLVMEKQLYIVAFLLKDIIMVVCQNAQVNSLQWEISIVLCCKRYELDCPDDFAMHCLYVVWGGGEGSPFTAPRYLSGCTSSHV